MADIEISRDAVQAGVDAYESAFLFDGTAEMVEVILKGAAPHIVAAYLEGPFADELKQRADARAQVGDDDYESTHEGDDACEAEGFDCHTAAAVATWLRARTMAKAYAIGLRAQS